MIKYCSIFKLLKTLLCQIHNDGYFTFSQLKIMVDCPICKKYSYICKLFTLSQNSIIVINLITYAAKAIFGQSIKILDLKLNKKNMVNCKYQTQEYDIDWNLVSSTFEHRVCSCSIHTSIFFIIMVYCCLWADDNMGFGGGDQSLSLAITTYFFTVGDFP